MTMYIQELMTQFFSGENPGLIYRLSLPLTSGAVWLTKTVMWGIVTGADGASLPSLPDQFHRDTWHSLLFKLLQFCQNQNHQTATTFCLNLLKCWNEIINFKNVQFFFFIYPCGGLFYVSFILIGWMILSSKVQYKYVWINCLNKTIFKHTNDMNGFCFTMLPRLYLWHNSFLG